jgi:hypothetical protein
MLILVLLLLVGRMHRCVLHAHPASQGQEGRQAGTAADYSSPWPEAVIMIVPPRNCT